MNIFFLDEEPHLAAQYQCDKHVVKMILESAQLLCTAHHEHPYYDFPENFYKKTHVNHPCSKWARTTNCNYDWLVNHALELCLEYTHRYGKKHKSQDVIEWCFWHYPNIEEGILTEPAQAMPDEYKVPGDAVTAYRRYYIEDKMKNIKCVWTKRSQPKWSFEHV